MRASAVTPAQRRKVLQPTMRQQRTIPTRIGRPSLMLQCPDEHGHGWRAAAMAAPERRRAHCTPPHHRRYLHPCRQYSYRPFLVRR